MVDPKRTPCPRTVQWWPSSLRRKFLEQTGLGLGALALGNLFSRDGVLADLGGAGSGPGGEDLRPRLGHVSPQARAVILLMQVGGPSQVDLFDPKPELTRCDGQKHPGTIVGFQRGSEGKKLMGSPFRFFPRGRCRMEISELLPHIASVADELCLIRSMYSDNNNHPQALQCFNTGKFLLVGRRLGRGLATRWGPKTKISPHMSFCVIRMGTAMAERPCGKTVGSRRLFVAQRSSREVMLC